MSNSCPTHSTDTILLKNTFENSLKAILSESQNDFVEEISKKLVSKNEDGSIPTFDSLRGEFQAKKASSGADFFWCGFNDYDAFQPINQKSPQELSDLINVYLQPYQKEISLGKIPFTNRFAPEHTILALANELVKLHTRERVNSDIVDASFGLSSESECLTENGDIGWSNRSQYSATSQDRELLGTLRSENEDNWSPLGDLSAAERVKDKVAEVEEEKENEKPSSSSSPADSIESQENKPLDATRSDNEDNVATASFDSGISIAEDKAEEKKPSSTLPEDSTVPEEQRPQDTKHSENDDSWAPAPEDLDVLRAENKVEKEEKLPSPLSPDSVVLEEHETLGATRLENDDNVSPAADLDISIAEDKVEEEKQPSTVLEGAGLSATRVAEESKPIYIT